MKFRPDFYELFANQKDWEERFLDPQYFESIEESNVPKQPCTDVYWFPLATPEFCESMIDIMEAFGKNSLILCYINFLFSTFS